MQTPSPWFYDVIDGCLVSATLAIGHYSPDVRKPHHVMAVEL